MGDDAEFSWDFRTMESVLARCYGIADSKRTTFAARLKNLHRLKFPLTFQAQQGKAARYSAGDIAMMALALEMTNLGLNPERLVRVLAMNWYPSSMAISMAASGFLSDLHKFAEDEESAAPEDMLHMFVFFDPAALSPLTFDYDPAETPDIDDAADSFFYGGQGVVLENLIGWTRAGTSRLSLVNITAMLGVIVMAAARHSTDAQLEFARRFLPAVVSSMNELQAVFEPARGAAQEAYLETFFRYGVPPVVDSDEIFDRAVAFAEAHTGFDRDFIEERLREFLAQMAHSRIEWFDRRDRDVGSEA